MMYSKRNNKQIEKKTLLFSFELDFIIRLARVFCRCAIIILFLQVYTQNFYYTKLYFYAVYIYTNN